MSLDLEEDMERKYEVGSHVIYFDSMGVPHDALVTIWWMGPNEVPTYRAENDEPGCNLVYVSGDLLKKDCYGRQSEHATSVVHKSKQNAHGYKWCWPDEL